MNVSHQPATGEVIEVESVLLRIITWYSIQQDVPRDVWEALTVVEKDLDTREQAAREREKERGY